MVSDSYQLIFAVKCIPHKSRRINARTALSGLVMHVLLTTSNLTSSSLSISNFNFSQRRSPN